MTGKEIVSIWCAIGWEDPTGRPALACLVDNIDAALTAQLAAMTAERDELPELRAIVSCQEVTIQRLQKELSEAHAYGGMADNEIVGWKAKAEAAEQEITEYSHEILQILEAAWPDQTLVWDSSPCELILKLVEERDDFKRLYEERRAEAEGHQRNSLRILHERDALQRDLDATCEAATQRENEALDMIQCPDTRMTLLEAIRWLTDQVALHIADVNHLMAACRSYQPEMQRLQRDLAQATARVTALEEALGRAKKAGNVMAGMFAMHWTVKDTDEAVHEAVELWRAVLALPVISALGEAPAGDGREG